MRQEEPVGNLTGWKSLTSGKQKFIQGSMVLTLHSMSFMAPDKYIVALGLGLGRSGPCELWASTTVLSCRGTILSVAEEEKSGNESPAGISGRDGV